MYQFEKESKEGKDFGSKVVLVSIGSLVPRIPYLWGIMLVYRETKS